MDLVELKRLWKKYSSDIKEAQLYSCECCVCSQKRDMCDAISALIALRVTESESMDEKAKE